MFSVHEERMGSNMDASQVVGEGNVSLSLNTLKVLDEGTYICTVSLGHFHAQQVIQLHVIRKCPFNPMCPFRKLRSMFSNSSSVFRTSACFTLRGETGFEVPPDTDLPLQ